MEVILTDHANEKLRILRAHGVDVARETVEQTVLEPEKVATGLGGREIAERSLDRGHVLRVVFINEGSHMKVITLYPARKGRY